MGKGALERWRRSRLYPAFRAPARLYRLALRSKAAFGLDKAWQNPASTWALGEFVHTVLPQVDSVVVLLGTPGPAQKITVQLWEQNRITGYLKYAEKRPARTRLEQEFEMLNSLPEGIGPYALKYGSFAEGVALVTLPVSGHSLPAILPPPPDLRVLLEKLTQPRRYALDEHPWIRRLLATQQKNLVLQLEPLKTRQWPVVIFHGDLAPWNLLRDSNGNLNAIDWEYGSVKGFPFVDLAYYLLQTSALVYRWSPARAKEYVINYLTRESWPTLKKEEAQAIVELTAYHAHYQAKQDEHGPKEPLQVWRRTIWVGS